MSFEVVETRPHLFGFRTIRVKALPETVVWAQYLMHGLSMPVEIILGSKPISTTGTSSDVAEILWLVACKMLLELSRCLEGGFTF